MVCQTVQRRGCSAVSRRALGCAMALLLAGPSPGLAQNPSTIERIKPSIVAVGVCILPPPSKNELMAFMALGWLAMSHIENTTTFEVSDAGRAEALASSLPTVIQAPMENAPTPTPGHWNINDIYRKGQ